MTLEDKLKNRIAELKKEDQEDLEFIEKSFPRWTKEHQLAVHNQENWAHHLIEQLERLLK